MFGKYIWKTVSKKIFVFFDHLDFKFQGRIESDEIRSVLW